MIVETFALTAIAASVFGLQQISDMTAADDDVIFKDKEAGVDTKSKPKFHGF